MNNLYNKIYEAINTGISKALIISNDQSQDASVIFYNKKTSADIDILNKYIFHLINDNEPEYWYEQIINYYNEWHRQYKVNDFNELTLIINKIKDIKDISLKWIDMSEYLSILLDDDTEVRISDFTNNMKPVFLKFSTDTLKESHNEILIYIPGDHLISNEELSWQKDLARIIEIPDNITINMKKFGSVESVIKVANNDLNGYTNYKKLLKLYINHLSNMTVIDYCHKKSINEHECYLPSMGQLSIILNNISLINYILGYINTEYEPITLKLEWCWSSTMYSNIQVWGWGWGETSWYNIETDTLHVLPVFTL